MSDYGGSTVLLTITAEKNLGNLRYFNFKKVPKFVNFPGEKGRFECLLRS